MFYLSNLLLNVIGFG
ncbi:hypothetical protein [Erwinia tasmaniensis]